MTDDDLVEGARLFLEQRGGEPPVPASPEAVSEIEALVGYRMPDLLRRLYLEVADGWPDWVSIAEMARWYQRWLEEAEPDPDEVGYVYVHPRTLVPVTEPDCGFHVTFVEFGVARGDIWLWNQDVGCAWHHWFAAPFTVTDCVAHWSYGARLRPWQQEPNRHCKRCRSETVTSGRCGMGIPDW